MSNLPHSKERETGKRRGERRKRDLERTLWLEAEEAKQKGETDPLVKNGIHTFGR